MLLPGQSSTNTWLFIFICRLKIILWVGMVTNNYNSVLFGAFSCNIPYKKPLLSIQIKLLHPEFIRDYVTKFILHVVDSLFTSDQISLSCRYSYRFPLFWLVNGKNFPFWLVAFLISYRYFSPLPFMSSPIGWLVLTMISPPHKWSAEFNQNIYVLFVGTLL